MRRERCWRIPKRAFSWRPQKGSSATSKQLRCCLASFNSLKFSSILPVRQLKAKGKLFKAEQQLWKCKELLRIYKLSSQQFMSFQEDISFYFLQPFLARYVDFFRSALQLHYYRININHTATEVVPKKIEILTWSRPENFPFKMHPSGRTYKARLSMQNDIEIKNKKNG